MIGFHSSAIAELSGDAFFAAGLIAQVAARKVSSSCSR